MKSNKLGAFCLLAASSAASAEETAQAAGPIEEMIVTGTSIKGVAAVGSETRFVSREDMTTSGLSNTNDILKRLPQFIGLGAEEGRGSSVQGAVANITQARTVNLRGLGPDSTLVLLDGRRIVPGGSQGQFYDVSVIPSNGIERVEVVADGASAIYGSEAVGGVVNFITRREYDGAETSARYGDGDGFDEVTVGQTFGKTWDGGDLFVAYEHFERSPLLGSERDVITQNLTPWGGPDLRSDRANPGTIVVDGVSYAIPGGQDGRSLTAADLVPGTENLSDVNDGRTFLADQVRNSVLASIQHQVSDDLLVWYRGYYNKREYDGEGISVNSGPDTATLTVPSSNPFFVHPTDPGAESVTVNYSFINDFRAESHGGEEGYQNSIGVEWGVGAGWFVDAYASQNENDSYRLIDGRIRTVFLADALADTNPDTAFNPFCDGGRFQCNHPDTLRRLEGFSVIASKLDMWNVQAKASGPLFELPGGEVQAAIGAVYTDYDMLLSNVRNTRVPEDDPEIPWNPVEREVKSAFAELLFPVVGPGNAINGVQRLDLSLAVRYDHYSDFGGTTNPKFGLRWDPTATFSVRASYGTSFRAPTMFDIDPIGTTGPGATFFTDPQTGQQIRGIHRQGPHDGLQPETATTWSLGFDYDPAALPGLATSLTYYSVDYEDRLASMPTNVLLENEALFPELVMRNPSAALVEDLMASRNYTTPWEPPENIQIVVDSRRNNLGGQRQSGLDASVSYHWDTTAAGVWTVGLDGNYILEAERSDAPGFGYYDILDTINNPVTPRGRFMVNWESGGSWSVDAFLNFVGAYENDLVTPSQSVSSWETVDLATTYVVDASGWLTGTTVTLTATNLFDEDPPVVVNTMVGNQGAYDSSYASAIGRVVALSLSKSW